MFISAKLLRKNGHRAWYAFGANKDTLNGILYVDIANMNDSLVEKISPEISYNGSLKMIARIISLARENNQFPEYCMKTTTG